MTDEREQPRPDKGPTQTPSASQIASERVWAIIGKVGALIGVLVGLFTLARFTWPPGPHIIADCQIVDSAVPPPSLVLGKLRAGLEAQLSPKAIEDALSRTRSSSRWSPTERAEAASAISGHLPVPDFTVLDNFGAASDLLQCRITNDGNEPAHQVVVDLPSAPSIVMSNSANLPLAEDQKSIALGDIRPGVDINLRVWFRFGHFWDKDRFQLSHQSGTGKLALFDIRMGFPGPVARFVIFWGNSPWLAGGIVMVLVAAIIDLALRIRSRTKAPDSTGVD